MLKSHTYLYLFIHQSNTASLIESIILPAITPKITFDGIFLMLGIHAKYVPWTMIKITRVDAKHEFSI